eukprot:symbB.v1.2.040140.t2/scaffold7023.1/size13778/2
MLPQSMPFSGWPQSWRSPTQLVPVVFPRCKCRWTCQGGTSRKSYASQWAALREGSVKNAVVTADHLAAARKAFGRKKQGRIRVNGDVVNASDAWAAEPGDSLMFHQGANGLRIADDLEKRLQNWNNLRSSREEAQIRLLHNDEGWAVVNKPAGLDSVPWTESHNNKRFTFQDYLPMVVPPPTRGTPCCGPRVCHRLDFRVAGPLVVATSLEAMRRLKQFFAQQEVEKEYRAIVCGRVKEAGVQFTIDEPLDGKPSRTDVKVLEVVRCPHYGALSMVLGRPIVNEDEGLFRAAEERWEDMGGSAGEDGPPLQMMQRGRGNLFLQAIQVSVPSLDESPGVTVRVAASDRFEELLHQAADAWARGWRTDAKGTMRSSYGLESRSNRRDHDLPGELLQDEWYSKTPLIHHAAFCYLIALDQWRWTNRNQTHFACFFTDSWKVVEMVKVQRKIREDPRMLEQVAGGQDLELAAESPLLTGRVVAQLAAEEALHHDAKRFCVTSRCCAGEVPKASIRLRARTHWAFVHCG